MLLNTSPIASSRRYRAVTRTAASPGSTNRANTPASGTTHATNDNPTISPSANERFVTRFASTTSPRPCARATRAVVPAETNENSSVASHDTYTPIPTAPVATSLIAARQMTRQERVVQPDAEAEKLLQQHRQRQAQQRAPQVAGKNQFAGAHQRICQLSFVNTSFVICRYPDDRHALAPFQ